MIDTYRLVGDPAALERAGLFVAEGRLIVERLLEDGRYRVHSVLVTPAAAAALAPVFEKRRDVKIVVSEPAEIERVTGFDFHRGCLALAHRHERFISIADLSPAPRILAIEHVANPDNIGGLFRVAFAMGVDGILLDPAAGDPLYRKAIRTSMGATLRLIHRRAIDWVAELGELRDRGARVVALTPHPDAVPIETFSPEPGERLVIAVGAEGHGLTSAAIAIADTRVRIPVDPRADSLNVVVAAGIALNRLFVR